MVKNDTEPPENKGFNALFLLRIFFGCAIIILGIIYTGATVAGRIPKNNQIDIVDLAVIAFAFVSGTIIINPAIYSRIKNFQLGGFKLEMLEKVKEKQAEQENKLEDITLILPLLLPKNERKHLLNLATENTREYRGNHALRSELRRLRSVGLIKSHSSTPIGAIKDNNLIDLAKFVELTSLGYRWVQRIKEIEKAETQEPDD